MLNKEQYDKIKHLKPHFRNGSKNYLTGVQSRDFNLVIGVYNEIAPRNNNAFKINCSSCVISLYARMYKEVLLYESQNNIDTDVKLVDHTKNPSLSVYDNISSHEEAEEESYDEAKQYISEKFDNLLASLGYEEAEYVEPLSPDEIRLQDLQEELRFLTNVGEPNKFDKSKISSLKQKITILKKKMNNGNN